MHEGNNLYLVIMEVCTDDLYDIWEERQFATKADNPEEARQKIIKRIREDEERVIKLGVSNYSGVFEIGESEQILIERNTLKQMNKISNKRNKKVNIKFKKNNLISK